MRILYVIDGLRKGGKERRFLQLVHQIEELKSIDYKIILLHREIEYLVSKEIQEKFIFIQKPTKKSFIPFFAIYRIAKHYKPDYLHTWSSMVTFYSLPTAILNNIKLINSQITDTPVKYNYFSFFGFICELNFIFSYKIIANTYSGLIAYRENNKKSLVIYNGFDFQRSINLEPVDKIKECFEIQTKYAVGMVASFSNVKDYSTYLKAALIVLSARDDITFLCVGSGDDSKYINSIPEQYKSHIKFLGKQDKVESIMNVCDIGVLASWAEGISNAIIEFCSLQKPVIAYKIGGNPEIIIDGLNGFLVTPADTEALANKIIDLLSNEELRCKMGIEGKSVVEEKFGMPRMLDEFIKLYI
jgi:glycosyltransferase involved in cell wall biosynthesis